MRVLSVYALVFVVLALWPCGASAADYLSGVFTSGGLSSLVEVRAHFPHHSDAHVVGRFRCQGDLCASRSGQFFEDNTSTPSIGSFVFQTRDPQNRPVALTTCTVTLSHTMVSECSFVGTYTCDSSFGLRTGDVYFIAAGDCAGPDTGHVRRRPPA